MLAAEGDLDAALNYLGNSQDEKIVMLKDRLCRALGYIEESKIVPKGPTMQNYYDRTRRSVQGVQNPLSGGPTRPFFDSNIAPTKQSFIPPPNQFNTQQQQQIIWNATSTSTTSTTSTTTSTNLCKSIYNSTYATYTIYAIYATYAIYVI